MNPPAPIRCPNCGKLEASISCSLCKTGKIVRQDTFVTEQPFDFFAELDRVQKILYPKG